MSLRYLWLQGINPTAKLGELRNPARGVERLVAMAAEIQYQELGKTV